MIANLNEHFTGNDTSFELLPSTRVQNATWFNNATHCTPSVRAVTNPLPQGNASTLSIYTIDSPPLSLVLYTIHPWDYGSFPKDNGVVLVSAIIARLGNFFGRLISVAISAVKTFGNFLGSKL